MTEPNKIIAILFAATLTGCATTPDTTPLYTNSIEKNAVKINFSLDKKYESKEGVPFPGYPLVCDANGKHKAFSSASGQNSIVAPAGKPIAIGSTITWVNTGWQKTCLSLAGFTPEENTEYTVVTERIGGKGISALWTGVAFQTCQTSVFKETSTGPIKIETQNKGMTDCVNSGALTQ